MDLKHVFQRIRDFLNMHFKAYDIVNCKHYIPLLKYGNLGNTFISGFIYNGRPNYIYI